MKNKHSVTKEYALNRLMQLCSHSEKSSYEIMKKLKEWGLENKADEILKELSDSNYIDDERYAKAFAHDKIIINKWGKNKVNFLLKRQQIKPINIQQALDSIDDEQYCKIVSEELEKKRKSIRHTSSLQLKAKLYAFGVQRGYESDLIQAFLQSL